MFIVFQISLLLYYIFLEFDFMNGISYLHKNGIHPMQVAMIT